MSKDEPTNAPGKTKISTIKQETLGRNLCFQQSGKNSHGKEVRKNKSSDHNLLLNTNHKMDKMEIHLGKYSDLAALNIYFAFTLYRYS